MNDHELPSKETFFCAFCEKQIDQSDGNEVLRRTKEGWLPFHNACAPDPEEGFTNCEIFYIGSSCRARPAIQIVECQPFKLPKGIK